jgi:hypothetical protein
MYKKSCVFCKKEGNTALKKKLSYYLLSKRCITFPFIENTKPSIYKLYRITFSITYVCKALFYKLREEMQLL